MSKQIIYLDELSKFINDHKISQKKVAEISEIDKTNLCLMLSGKLKFGEKESKKGRAFNGTTEDRCKSILGKLVDYVSDMIYNDEILLKNNLKEISNKKTQIMEYRQLLDLPTKDYCMVIKTLEI